MIVFCKETKKNITLKKESRISFPSCDATFTQLGSKENALHVNSSFAAVGGMIAFSIPSRRIVSMNTC